MAQAVWLCTISRGNKRSNWSICLRMAKCQQKLWKTRNLLRSFLSRWRMIRGAHDYAIKSMAGSSMIKSIQISSIKVLNLIKRKKFRVASTVMAVTITLISQLNRMPPRTLIKQKLPTMPLVMTASTIRRESLRTTNLLKTMILWPISLKKRQCRILSRATCSPRALSLKILDHTILSRLRARRLSWATPALNISLTASKSSRLNLHTGTIMWSLQVKWQLPKFKWQTTSRLILGSYSALKAFYRAKNRTRNLRWLHRHHLSFTLQPLKASAMIYHKRTPLRLIGTTRKRTKTSHSKVKLTGMFPIWMPTCTIRKL